MFAAFTALISVAQSVDDDENVYNQTRIGIKAGIQITDFKTDDQPGTNRSSILRLRFGLFTHIPISENVFFRPAIMLVGKGSKSQTEFPVSDKLGYIELPLNILYKAASSEGIFLLGGGPAPAFLINETFYNPNLPGGVKKFDLGINAMVAYERPLGLSINLHYTYGLLNITRERSLNPAINNRSFGISLGYLF